MISLPLVGRDRDESWEAASFLGKSARLAQRLGRPRSLSNGKHDLHGDLWSRSPTGVDQQPPNSISGSQRVANNFLTDSQRCHRAPQSPRFDRRCLQGPVRNADRWQVEDGTKVERQPSSPRMVKAGGVDQQNVRLWNEPSHGVLEQRSLPQGQISGHVRRSHRTVDGCGGDSASTFHYGRRRPCGIARRPNAGDPGAIGNERSAHGDWPIFREGPPLHLARPPSQLNLRALQLGERLGPARRRRQVCPKPSERETPGRPAAPFRSP